MGACDILESGLTQLSAMGRRRSLMPRTGLDFSSNDYLGLAASSRLRAAVVAALARGVPIGSGGSRLLRGNCEEHELLEEEAAQFFGSEAALFVGSGYGANALLFSTLPQRGDLVVYDELIHASAHEGMRLGRAETRGFAHNDVDAAADVIAAWRNRGGSGTPWLAMESLYSMDGDRAPLTDAALLAERQGAMLLIDEAHATGVFGPDGRGLAADLDGGANVVVLRTCGKALGCEGALILAPVTVRDFLINRGRGFIFSTAPSPLIAAVVRDALRCLRDEPERRDRLHALLHSAARELCRIGMPVSGSPIQPVVIGDDRRTMEIAAVLQATGFDVRGVRPPTVPPGTARLRLSFTLNVDEASIAALVTALQEHL
ncbi:MULTISPECIES: 8-amino-7-oxononanoate synthase [Sphingosinicellaceae]|uniref:8-amino-7-oxononanoate synthase n=1 Tax=Sphingosinicellaceae TaxID=2820280 RepID=UPI001C1DFB42|nr:MULTISPECIES: 8-amino-7-oxononanoate synthase [Polymorphobacter]QYE35602.1 8-amino-7-oxononanoate synthase [Polymorphobacter sp. PAMC 29334]UAJ11031.1 8-amino-7-oxononanoate synthase [Polymorphobacter megasporae]